MLDLSRRRLLRGGAAIAGSSFILPRMALAQAPAIIRAEDRPTITIAVQQVSTSASIEPTREQSNVGERTFSFIFEALIGRNLGGKLEPMPALAESWRRIDDRTVELSLRKGVKFHNGDEMTADDVVFTFSRDRMFGPDYDINSGQTVAINSVRARDSVNGKKLPVEVIAIAKRAWPALEQVVAIDKYTVRFVNHVPDVTLEGRLLRSGSEIISQRGYMEAASYVDWARKPVATGPYKVREYQPDQMLILDAHDEYWGGRPPIKTIRIAVVPEVASRINGLLSGQYDFACDMPPDQIAGIESNPRFEVKGGLISNHRLTVFDKTHPELVDPRIRQAITHAIDRQAIVDSLWAGRTRVPPGLQWEFYGPMFVEGWTVPAYDPEKAQALLKAANYKGGAIPYRLLNNYYTNQTATAQVLTEMWRSVGLNIELGMKESWEQVFERNGQRAIRDWSNSAPFNDPVSSIVASHGPNGQQQQVGEWTNEEMNRLSPMLETETDMTKRKAIFKRMLEICEREDPAYTVLHQNATFTAKRKDIQWNAAPAFAMDFRAGNFAINRA
ncbi:MAG TPA: ABC transporter substrate-binding protein [Stellaceae bacterium]|nr:ABC transporter substrate-binding protein [Stellaceae bacterium]